MRLIIITIITSLVAILFLIPTGKYIHSKTLGIDKTDCMVNYVKNYYPEGSTYLIYGKYPHIDKRGIGNQYMIETKKIEGCFIDDSIKSFIFNTPYCYITLLYENI